MLRKDKIMALAISNTKKSESLVRVKPANTTKNKNSLNTSDDKQAAQKSPILTDLNELWSRPLDFNKFPAIFENQNEYCNSFDIVEDLDLSSFTNNMYEDTLPSTRQSLICYENLPDSDDDNRCNTTDLFDSDDSVKDKDYDPKSTDYNSDSSGNFNVIVPKTVTVDASKHTDSVETNSVSSYDCNETRQISIIVNAEIHDERARRDTWNVHEVNNNKRVFKTYHNVIETGDDIIEVENVDTQNMQNQMADNDFVEPASEKGNIETSSNVPECEKGLTKLGLPRKRRKFEESLHERKSQKKEASDEKLTIKPPCNDKCRKKCTTKFTEDMRSKIHDKYINLTWESRGLFIKGHVESRNVRTRTTQNDEKKKDRAVSHFYYLYTENRERTEVCRPFFLTTLGYNAQNTRHIYTALSKDIDDQKDKRGGYKRTDVIDKDIIKDHIASFNPLISHYRREHAPKRLYLPSDLNITLMHQCFMNINPETAVSLETYRKVVKDMNISFAHLGNEECEDCALFKSHKGCSEVDCEICAKISDYEVHKLRYTESRQEYQKDKDQASSDAQCIYVSVDLQKVIQLPRMDQFKTAIFCPRIIAFNESFVPLGSSTSGPHVPYAVLWNETVSGRRQEDIISAYRSFFIHHRDVKHFVLWADNCSAQNKNWALMCFLVNIVNSNLVGANSITMKFFEPGHTFMSADHFHHQVEKALKQKGKVYDMDDFVDAVKMSNSKKNTVKIMQVTDFFNYEDYSSQHKLKNITPRVYLHNIMTVEAERGAFNIKYKESHVENEWKELDFLQVKMKKNKSLPNPSVKVAPRGIAKDRLQNIIKKLVPLMPETRRHFWMNLPETTLTTNNID